MRAQGQTGVVESSSTSMGKSSRKEKVSKERARPCSALEPVLEHCELSFAADSTDGPSCKTILGSRPKPSRSMLSKVLAGYVKLMNDVASGADVKVVSSFYAASSRTGDYPCKTGNARIVVKETTEKELQLSHRFASQS